MVFNMTKITIKQVKNYAGKSILLCGFVYNIQEQGSITFLVLRDITGTVQCIITKLNEKAFQEAKNLTLESSIKIKGLIKKEEKAPGGFEIDISSIELISKSESILPIPVYEKSGQTASNICHKYRFLDLRKPKNALVIKLSSAFDRYYREFLVKKGFLKYILQS